MSSVGHTDIRLVPVTAELHAALMSEDAARILAGVRYLVTAYEAAPPLTLSQAAAYTIDVEWWRSEIADL